MLDPFAIAVGVGLLGSVIAGPVVVYGLEFVPQKRRRTTEWLLIVAAVVVAVLCSTLPLGGAALGFVYVLAALPGFVAFLAFRTLLATALVSLAPLYFVIGHLTREWPTFRPELALDRAVPLQPAWMFVYGSLYVFVFFLPLLVVRQQELLRRTMQSLLMVMMISYIGFLLYPTAAPRPNDVVADSFASWALSIAYAIDPPHGCFPSLHVAYSVVAALACWRVHRGVGAGALLWAALIGMSTLFTKQHYVVDVIAGALLAGAAYLLFLRTYPRDAVAETDRRNAPIRAFAVMMVFGIMAAGWWVTYRIQLAGA